MLLQRTSLGCLAAFLITSWASAQEVYVDSELGNDSNEGSEANPLQTLSSVSGFGARYDTLYLKAGGTYETSGLNVSNATVTRYGEGPAPVVVGNGEGFGLVSASGNAVIDGIKVMGANVDVGGTGISVNGDDNEVRNCEVDGSGSGIMLGFGIMGEGNHIHHNNVHDLGVSVSGDQMGTSGGAEAYMVTGSNNEIAYNIAIDCWADNSTLGGAEGGCLEIVNQNAGATVSGVSFHHNYCERSVGLFEGCSGDFSGTDQIQLNHGIIADSYVAYNVAIDAMWLYLLAPVNTDFRNVVFEHNTIIHTEVNEDIPQGAASAFTLAVAEETVDGTSYGPYPIQASDVIVRNNSFIVAGGQGMFNGDLPNGDHYNNLFVGVSYPNIWTQHATEVVADLAVAAFDENWRLTADSVAIDAGSTTQLRSDWLDFDGNAVPQGAAPDIGAFEYCEGTDCQEATEISSGGSTGTGGAPASGGDTATGTGGAGVLTCTDPLSLCGEVCVNLTSDANNCGDCGVTCDANQVCSAGVCTTGACPAGTTQCGQNCVDLMTDPLNCGGCDMRCAGGQSCTNGVCTGEATGLDPTQPVLQAQPESTTESSGCACVAAGAGSRTRGALLGLLFGLGWLWRRRSRSRSPGRS